MLDKLSLYKIVLNYFFGGHGVQKLAGLRLKHIPQIGAVEKSRRTHDTFLIMSILGRDVTEPLIDSHEVASSVLRRVLAFSVVKTSSTFVFCLVLIPDLTHFVLE